MNEENGMNFPALAGFFFRKRSEPMDWKRFAAADLHTITNHLDFMSIQDNLLNVTFCDVDNEFDTRHVDPNLIKMIKFAQLTIEYLLHCQDYMTEYVSKLETQNLGQSEEIKELRKRLNEKQETTNELKRECHRRKKLILAQQQIMDSGPMSHNQCAFCSKAFLNPSFLQKHVFKRHADLLTEWHGLPDFNKKEEMPVKAVLSVEIESKINELINRIQRDETDVGKGKFVTPDLSHEDLIKEYDLKMEQMKRMFESKLESSYDKYESLLQKFEGLEKSRKEPTVIGEIETDESEKIINANDRLKEKVGLKGDVGSFVDEMEIEYKEKKGVQSKRQKNKSDEEKRFSTPPPPKQVKEDDFDGVRSKSNNKSSKSPEKKNRISFDKSVKSESEEEEEVVLKRQKKFAVQRSGGEQNTSAGQTSLESSVDTSDLRTSTILRANPKVLETVRKDLLDLLDEQLEDRGIRRNTTQIPTSVLNDKLKVLRLERNQLMAKFSLFQSIRDDYIETVDEEARLKIFGNSSTPSPNKHKVSKQTVNNANTQQQQQRKQSPSNSSQLGKQKLKRISRSNSASAEEEEEEEKANKVDKNIIYSLPKKKSIIIPTNKVQLQASDEENQASSSSPLSPRKPRRSVSQPNNINEGKFITNNTSASPSPKLPIKNQFVKKNEKHSNSDWDEDSDDPDVTNRREMEKEIRSLGLDVTMGSGGSPDKNTNWNENKMNKDFDNKSDISDDDDVDQANSSSMLSLNDSQNPLSHMDSSNTFGTSQWQSASKPVSTVNPGATQKSMATNKSSEIGVDDDDDFKSEMD